MVDILRADYRAIKKAGKTLIDGRVIAFATETVYGIGALYDNDEAIAKLRQIKGSDADKPLQVLIPNIKYAYRYAACENPRVQALMHTFWPGALTLILPGYNNDTVGLRIPDNKWLRVLMLELKSPIVATSANLSGEEPAVSPSDIENILGDSLALIIDGGEARIGQGSTVVNITPEGELEILRHGAIPEKALKDVYYG